MKPLRCPATCSFRHLAERLLAILFASTILSHAVASEVVGYTLGEGDVISINVYGESDLSFDAMRVGGSGKISFPFLGEIDVKGMTLTELRNNILAGLKPDYLIDPRISVSIVEYRPFYISGEVKRPGSYPYQPGLKLRQAISLAEGFTERASQSRITVVPDNDPEAKPKRADLSDDVRPGDTITVGESFF